MLIFEFPLLKGITFWKVGSRKIFAVREDALQKYADTVEEEESDAAVSLRNNRKRKSFASEDDDTDAKITKMTEELREIKGEIKRFRELAFRHKFSAAFLAELEGAFTCIICKRVPVRKPIMGCTSCSSLIGCQVCVDRWFSGTGDDVLAQKCPKCRCERGISKTITFRGFDNLVSHIKALKEGSDSSSGESDDLDELPI